MAAFPLLQSLSPWKTAPSSTGSGGWQKLTRRWGIGYAAPGISRDTLIRLIDYPELPLRIHTRDTIKAGRSALLVRGEFPIGGRMVSVAYKRIKRKNLGKMAAAWLLGNRSLRTWNMARRFEAAGIPTARPLALVIPRWYQPHRPSYLAWEWLPDTLNLTTYNEWLQQLPSYERHARLHAAAERLGQCLGEMHAVGLSHRDLKAGNLLLANRPSSVEVFVIDLDGARQHIWLRESRRLRDLSRLAFALHHHSTVTHSARLRFLRAYLRSLGQPVTEWKTAWRKLAAETAHRQAAKQKRGSRTR